MFSCGVNGHSTTSATFFWNYRFTYMQIIFILPLCTLHILRICDDYHHFPDDAQPLRISDTCYFCILMKSNSHLQAAHNLSPGPRSDVGHGAI